jgi:hypothetical protein
MGIGGGYRYSGGTADRIGQSNIEFPDIGLSKVAYIGYIDIVILWIISNKYSINIGNLAI